MMTRLEAAGPTLLPGSESPAALAVAGLTKAFVGRVVLDNFDIKVKRGEIHALLGQNGSGKSTFIKCLAGVYRADAGSISVAGMALPKAFPPNAARKFGLGFVHQDLGLALDMTIADNLGLVRGFHTAGPFVRQREQARSAREILDFVGVKATPQTLVRDLPVTARTLLAIGRAVDLQDSSNLNCLVLDEPTASLPDTDAHLLFDAVRQLSSLGVAVIYVSHRLEEIERLADNVTVLRDGRKIATHQVANTTRAQLVEEILGETSGGPRGRTATTRALDLIAPPEKRALRAENISGVRVANVSFAVEPGEIVGVAGLAGSGRSELCRLLFGAQRLTGGRVWIGDTPVEDPTPAKSIRAGVAYIPEDRRGQACLMTMTVRENIMLLRSPIRRGLIDRRRDRQVASDAIDQFDVRPRDPEALVASLSGGNQQKVMLAKWFGLQPSVIVLDEPVQGVDVGAKAQVFEYLRAAASAGAAVLVVDSDFDNLTDVCDRVLIIRQGELVGEVDGDSIDTSEITRATFGVSAVADHVAAANCRTGYSNV
ncbi:sugar ABC transporter ATP-binding protein [Acrocarpospora macrocephala]|uniref:Ribose import ATP-binding protein RbsA n=1 Tax=Acrocarpospora macrocephala TaxID=150177 RepID=A0A5M3WLX6_9ACTN|nr:sugar ABC transporter ATP-binding protein [Acrocarpospora macrocephala]GES09636.1 ribose import ATP-binding protein RbsA [Acrocarpospora macrocephala]